MIQYLKNLWKAMLGKRVYEREIYAKHFIRDFKCNLFTLFEDCLKEWDKIDTVVKSKEEEKFIKTSLKLLEELEALEYWEFPEIEQVRINGEETDPEVKERFWKFVNENQTKIVKKEKQILKKISDYNMISKIRY